MTWRGCKPFSKERYKEFEWLKTSRGTLSGCFKGYLGPVEAFRSCSRVNSIYKAFGNSCIFEVLCSGSPQGREA